MSQVTGRIINYRVGIRSQINDQILVQLSSASEAGKLVGKKIVWKQNKRAAPHVGKIIGLHGKKGVVKAKFARSIPGQAIGTVVTVVA